MTWKKVFEKVQDDCRDLTHRLEVEGGYLYRNIIAFPESGPIVTMAFVKLPDKCEYHKQHRLYVCAECFEESRKRQDAPVDTGE
jgi:hypothetical protein